MKIRVLGIAGGLPELGLHHSGIYFQTSEKNILVDCGGDIPQQILKFNLGKNIIDEIYISHLHPDHFSGIFLLIQMFYLQKRTKDLYLYLPEEIEKIKEMFKTMYIFKEKFSYKIHFMTMKKTNQVIPIENSHLKTYKEFILKNNHTNSLMSYSYVIKENKKQVIFTSDIVSVSHLEAYIPSSRIIFIDAFHPKSNEILKLSDSFEGDIFLTHAINSELKLLKNKRNNIFNANEKDEIIF